MQAQTILVKTTPIYARNAVIPDKTNYAEQSVEKGGYGSAQAASRSWSCGIVGRTIAKD